MGMFFINSAILSSNNFEDTVFDHNSVTYTGNIDDSQAVNLGLVAIPLRPGSFTKIYFWKTAADASNTRTVGVYNSAGVLITSQTTSGEVLGWNEIILDEPVVVDTWEKVTVAVHFPSGNYPLTASVFANDVYSRGNGFLSPDNDNTSNNTFRYSADLAFPDNASTGGSYGVDVCFEADALPTDVSLSEFPDETNTGSSGTLDSWAFSNTIDANNTIIVNKTFTGVVTINADNVRLINCQIDFSDFYGIEQLDGKTGLQVIDCTITGPGLATNSNTCISGSGIFKRNKLSGSGSGASLKGGSSTVKDNYIFDLATAGADPHYDGIQIFGGQANVLIQHNTIYSHNTSHILVSDLNGAINGVTITENQLLHQASTTGPSYNIYVTGDNGNGTTDVTISNNKIQQGEFGYFSFEGASATLSGNTDLVGNPIP